MKKTIYLIGVLCLLFGCAEHDNVTGLDASRKTIRISSAYPSAGVLTRATIDGGFVAGDEIGIFVVDYDGDNQPGTMAMQGNRASNIRFTMQDDGSWTAPVQLYWDVKGAAADFYGYYPFDVNLSSVTAYRFAVEPKQDTEATSIKLAGYTASDLLWGKKEHVEQTTETVTLQYHHLMAGVAIRLECGTGFTAEEWAALDKEVFLKNTVIDGTVNLSTGTVSVSDGSPTTIRPLCYNGDYRAIIFPQTVAAGKELIQVLIDGKNYGLKKTEVMTFLSGKMHQFTITINRSTVTGDYTVTLADEAITPWMEDADLHDGLTRQYVAVENLGAGRLQETLASMHLDYSELTAMMLKGDVNLEDMYFMGQQMKSLTSLNMSHANIVGEGESEGLLTGFKDHHILYHFVFPEKGVKTIGVEAFRCAGLKGSLVIPEGVETIGNYAFYNEWGDEDFFGGLDFSGHVSLTGTLTLPTTLKRIGCCAFSLNRMRGELRLPEGLEFIDNSGGDQHRDVFYGCDFSGTLTIPSKLTDIAFGDFPNMHGDIIIPQGVTRIRDLAFAGSGFDGIVSIPEGVTDIGSGAFLGLAIHGELVLPSTLERIGGTAFAGTRITKVIFPDALKIMSDGNYDFEGVFAGSRLMGTLELPKNVTVIPKGCFMNCSGITELIIPKGTIVLSEKSFAGCASIGSIVCQGEEPPIILDEAFLGVPKDNFTVEVPKGCVEKYRNAPGWGDFRRIAEYSNFVCRPATACALNERHQEQLVLNADGAWTVTSKPDWVTLSSTSGTGKTSITATFQPLSHGSGNRTDDVVFEMSTDGKTFTTSCKLSQYDYEYEEDSYLALQTATKGQRGGIDIVFVGDGFDGANISDGSYLDLVRYQTECFFAIEPYKSMRDYFNVYVTFPLSQERGVNTMYTYVNNRFGTLQGLSLLLDDAQRNFTSQQLLMETDEVRDYVVENTPVEEDNLWRTLVIAVPNSTDYEGNTVYCNGGPNIAICPPSEQAYPRDTRGVIQHEAGGHAFAYLGDEMIVRNAFAPTSVKSDIEEKHGWGWYPNLATTGKLNSVPWAELIFDPDYSDYVDVYEGGYGYTRGIYRPEANSCMNYGIPYYNTPSRLAIYRRILDYAGEEFRMENFRAQDTFEWGATEITRAAARDIKNLTPITDGNHHVPVIVRYREVGNKVRAIRKKLRVKN